MQIFKTWIPKAKLASTLVLSWVWSVLYWVFVTTFFIYLFIHLFIYLFITHILVRRPGIGTVYSCKLRSLWCWSNVGTTFMYRRWINYVGPILERWQCTNSDIYNVGLMLVQCRSTNSDNVQTLCQHWVSLSLLSGMLH